MEGIVLASGSDSESSDSRSEDDEEEEEEEQKDYEKGSEKGSEKGNEKKPNLKLTKVSKADLTPDHRALITTVNKLTAEVLNEHLNAAPISLVLTALKSSLDLLSPELNKVAAIKSQVDREVALKTEELSTLVNAVVSAEAAIQGLKSLRAFSISRNSLSFKCGTFAAFGHKTVRVPFDFTACAGHKLLAFVGTKGVASLQLSTVTLWMLFCDESKSNFLTVRGTLGSKALLYKPGQFAASKNGHLQSMYKKIKEKKVNGFNEDGCLASELKFALTESLEVARVFDGWRAFEQASKEVKPKPSKVEASLWF